MSRQILKDIIEDFDDEKFIRFFRVKNNKFRYPNQPLPYQEDNFQKSTKIAEVSLEDGSLIVCSFLVKQPLSERSGKKAQYEIGKKVLKESQTDAGIFIFYDAQGNFRFSLIYTNYLGRRKDWSNFRRFTYFVSRELTNKTFLQRIGEGDLSNLEQIKEAFSVEKVTKEFYQEIANWYFWAVQESKFPEGAEKEENGRNIAIIRLITRLIFIWFMKEKGLIQRTLFNYDDISRFLKDTSPENTTYYKAILQNLFFATLSTKQNERDFRSEIRGHKGYNPDFGRHHVFRYHELFKNQQDIKNYFGKIPFLNGGLFECLDDKDNRIYIDGFTATRKHQPGVPNFLFFSDEMDADLNKDYGTKNKKYRVKGLLNILSSYNFTIDENVPDDQEVALDPELLGKVFENLLASFNPETASTARKATGSYYTPREIVDYMVVQSLKEFFRTNLSERDCHCDPVVDTGEAISKDVELDKKLNNLLSYDNNENLFCESDTRKMVKLINNLRIIDPAVGSGAFPMGILNKLVFILSKIDPNNDFWKQEQLNVVENIPDPKIKQESKEYIEKLFKEKNVDYGRKLYLIQKCIYGVDIQQIAVEIAKLRFFISLLVDEKIDKEKENLGIEPLPNLDFKLMQGNSLISEFMGISFDKDTKKDLFRTEEDDLIEKFQQKKNEFQNEPEKSKKDKLRDEIDDLMIEIFESKLQRQKADYFRELKNIEDKYLWVPNEKQRNEAISKEKQALYERTGFDLESAEKQLRDFSRGQKEKPFFLWSLYFAEVFRGENPGFDIVIANPPYGNLLKAQEKKLMKRAYLFSTFSDISSPFIEKSFNLLRDGGNLVFIITYAITFNKDFSKSRELTANGFSENYIYTFDRDKCRIFKSMTQTVSIIKCFNKNAPDKKGIWTSRMFRETPDINKIEATNCNKYLIPKISGYNQKHRLPKIGEEINRQILDKLLQFNDNVGGIIKNNGSKIWIRTSGNYWYNAFDRKPYNSVEISSLYVDKDYANFLILMMNSSLFYFWFRIYGDGRHMNMDILESFPLPNREKILHYNVLLNKTKERFMNKLFSVFEKERSRFITSNIKSEIDLLDLILGKYFYNLDYNEIIHILNYDFEIRGGNKLEKPFIDLVDKILAITNPPISPFNKGGSEAGGFYKGGQEEDYLNDPTKQAKVKEYERQIDQMVYELYGLTDDEIATVEGRT